MPKHRNHRKYWMPEQEEIVRKHYADSTHQQMDDLLNGAFDIRQIHHKAKNMGIRKSQAYRELHGIDEKGRKRARATPWNKGTHFRAGGLSNMHRFKLGNIPPNHRLVWSTRINVDGCIEIKIEEGIRKWKLMHHQVWKQHHGSYPPRGTALIFRDGNKQNCDIDNLELLTRKQLMERNTIHQYPEEIKQLIRLKAKLTRRINGR